MFWVSFGVLFLMLHILDIYTRSIILQSFSASLQALHLLWAAGPQCKCSFACFVSMCLCYCWVVVRSNRLICKRMPIEQSWEKWAAAIIAVAQITGTVPLQLIASWKPEAHMVNVNKRAAGAGGGVVGTKRQEGLWQWHICSLCAPGGMSEEVILPESRRGCSAEKTRAVFHDIRAPTLRPHAFVLIFNIMWF